MLAAGGCQVDELCSGMGRVYGLMHGGGGVKWYELLHGGRGMVYKLMNYGVGRVYKLTQCAVTRGGCMG